MRQAVITPRERATLMALADGKPNKTISFEMGISEMTVKVQIKNLLRAFRFTNRTELAIAVYAMGLRPLPAPSVELCEKRLVPLNSHAEARASA